jgi:DNA-binding transcriptional LysR family regulator
MHQLALEGAGIARLATFQVAADIQNKKLTPLLEKYNSNDSNSIYAIYVGQGSSMPAHIRVFLDFLAKKFIFKPIYTTFQVFKPR